MSVFVLIAMFGQSPAEETTPCGVGAAYLLLQRLGDPRSLEEIEAVAPARQGGLLSLSDLAGMFEKLGYDAIGYKLPLNRLDRPAIAYRPERGGHFYVIEPIADGRFLLMDPNQPPIKAPYERVAPKWDGRVLLVFPTGPESAAFVRQAKRTAWLSAGYGFVAISTAACVPAFWLWSRRRRSAITAPPRKTENVPPTQSVGLPLAARDLSDEP